jgi:predicted ATPase/DNA-binding winged helix-turn-helix (wHTH) protein
MDPASETPAGVAFGHFRVLPHRRELLADGQPIKLGGRAFDVLMALIEARGAVVGKDALMQRVWPNRIVEESSLPVQILALRNALGAERELIHTVAGHGYQFTGEIRELSGSPDERAGAGMAAAQPAAALPPTNLPAPVSELIGRDDELREILGLAAAHRLVTLTGAGGIGKTRLALAVARRLLPKFADGVWVAELAPLTDPGLVAGTVAAAVGLEQAAGTDSPERVASGLSGKRLLLVLDNCEHVIDVAARMAEALLRASPVVHVIATSREPLKTEGEWTFPVPPLAVPARDAEDEDDLLRYGAVRLFVERARAAAPHFAPDRRSAAVIAAICRRLDGIPLAIELAAARAAALGIEEVAGRLDDRFRLLTGGQRAALPRHQTLRATLDWSYELLSAPERIILRRLAVFAGAFSLEAASVVAASLELAPAEVVDGLSNLVAKSLVAAEVDGAVARYRLLETTRDYALEKLAESGERDRLARHHAEYGRDLLERAESESETRPTAEWLADYGWRLDNLRASLDWAFSPAGDAIVGVAMTAAAVPLWMQLSLPEECRGRVERALAALAAGASRDARREMKLHAALGASLIYTRGPAGPETGAAWTKALELAEGLDDAEYRLVSLGGLWFFHGASSQHRMALELAQRFCALAARRPDPNYRLVGERMIAVSQHYLGDHSSARRHLERVLAEYVTPDYTSPLLRFQFRPHVAARVFLAWILWLQGLPDQAIRAAENSVEEARAANHVLSLCYALTWAACPIALLVGDLAAAESYLKMLLDQSTRHSLPLWGAFGRSHWGVLLIARGDLDAGLRLLRASYDEFGEGTVAWRLTTFRTFRDAIVAGEALGRTGKIGDGLVLVGEAIDHSERTEERWAFAELLRVKGELLLLQGAPGAARAAEDHFRQALDWARRHGALSWELRAAASLARLLRDQGQSADAMALLQPVYDRFTEGFDTADLKAAKALLGALR